MTSACEVICSAAGSRVLILSPRDSAGWERVPKKRSASAVEFTSSSSALSFIRDHSFFRTQFFADYYLMDQSFSWLVKFCHEGDWHAFLPEKIACSLALKRVYFALKFTIMPPWPPAAVYDDE